MHTHAPMPPAGRLHPVTSATTPFQDAAPAQECQLPRFAVRQAEDFGPPAGMLQSERRESAELESVRHYRVGRHARTHARMHARPKVHTSTSSTTKDVRCNPPPHALRYRSTNGYRQVRLRNKHTTYNKRRKTIVLGVPNSFIACPRTTDTFNSHHTNLSLRATENTQPHVTELTTRSGRNTC